MSIEGFLNLRKRFRTKHNIYQLTANEEHADLDVMSSLLNQLGDEMEKSANNGGWLLTMVPPGYKWELVK